MRAMLAVGLLLGCADDAPRAAGEATVAFVVDGDTIVVDVGGTEERVRLIGIDTPELHADGSAPPECGGPEARDFTRALLPAGTIVRLARDVVARDDYGRLLAYVSLADGRLVNEEIVAAGHATPLTIAPNDAFAPRFVAAATAAEAAGLGLWGACRG